MPNFDVSVFRDLFDHAFDAQWVLDSHMKIEHANAAAASLTGYAVDQLVGQPLSVLLPPEVAQHHGDYVARYQQQGETLGVMGKPRRFEVLARDGSLIPIQLKAFRLPGADGEYKFGATMVDLREQVRLEQQQKHIMSQLEKLALIDPLTELWNRRAFDDALDRQCAFIDRHEDPAAIAMIDIDHFKRVNDTYGHSAGDKVLQQLARHLMHIVRREDVCARMGGEEFAILMPATSLDAAKSVMERALQIVATGRFDLGEGRQSEITFSAGISAIDPGMRGHVAIEHADLAMYQAKEAGRARVELWTQNSDVAVENA